MRKKVLSPSELIEFRTQQQEEAKILASKLEEERRLQEKKKRLLSPRDVFGSQIESKETKNIKEEFDQKEQIIEEQKDPVDTLFERVEEVSASIKELKSYDEEIYQVNSTIQEIKNNISEVSKVKGHDEKIQNILDRLNSLDIRYYESDIQSINDRLNCLQQLEDENSSNFNATINKILEDIKHLYELEILDPKDTQEYINSIKESFYKNVDEIKEQISNLPKVKYYDNELIDLQKEIESVRLSIPEIPEIKYYDEELENIFNFIEDIRTNISNIPEIKYYEKEISQLEKLIEKVEDKVSKLPEIKHYETELLHLEQSIKEVDNKISEFPEIKHYDSQIDQLTESIEKIQNKIQNVPDINSYEQLKKTIIDVKENISKFPIVKYYDTELFEVNNSLKNIKEDLIHIQDFANSIQIIEKIDWSNEIKNVKEEIEKLKEIQYINEETEIVAPLDQKFATLDDLQNHYRVFISKVQAQLASIGGGGETRLEFLDDVDRNSIKTNGYVLAYQESTGKFIGTAISGGGGGGSSNYSEVAGIATYAITSGISTYATISGISTVSQGLIGTPSISVNNIIAKDAYFSGNVSIAGTLTYEDVTNVDSLGIITARSGIIIGPSVSVGATINPFGDASFAGVITAREGSFDNLKVSGNSVIAGISTFSSSTGVGTVTVGIGQTALFVDGNARVTGILTVGKASIRIDGDNNTITTGDVNITGSSITLGENITINSSAAGINSAPNVIYVAKDGNDSNNGTSIDNAKSSIAGAVSIAQTGTVIKVLSGTYNENNPIEVPAFVSIVGDSLKTVTIVPNNATQDIFYLNKGTYLSNMTFTGHTAPAAAVAFPPTIAKNIDGGSWESPYVQNCTSNTTTGTGMRIDGNLSEGLKSMVVDSYTQYNQGGVGIAITNSGYAQLVSVFTICCNEGVTAHKGGQCSLTNSNTDFGTFGLVADGVSNLQFSGVASTSNAGTASVKVALTTSITPYEGQVVYFGTLYYTVQSIKIIDGGSGYTSTPTVSISTPTGPNGVTATAFATLDGDKVSEITIINSGNQYIEEPSVTISSPDIGTTATASANINPIYYTINSSTPIVSGITTISLEENLINTVSSGTTAYFYQLSKITASSHTFEYVGSGNDIATATPLRGGTPIQENEIVERNGGRVVFTSTDQAGNFRIGNDIVINQNNGTISGRAFTRSLFNQMTPFILALT